MRLWTIQPFSVWTQLGEDGEARVLPTRWSHPDNPPVCYDWLREELAGRVKNDQGGYPWWCYCEKPDLRTHRHGSLSGGMQQVRLELEVDGARVAVFQIWGRNRICCELYLGSLRQERDWRRRRRESFVDRDLRDWELGPPGGRSSKLAGSDSSFRYQSGATTASCRAVMRRWLKSCD